MTKSELRDHRLIWNNSNNSVCLDDFLKRYGRISKDITIESKPNSYSIITETLRNMLDVHDFLKRMINCEIKITKVEMEAYSLNTFPEIHVKYFVLTDSTTVIGTLETPKNIGIDTYSHDNINEFIKREMKKQFAEELERANVKEEPKEETVLEFKEISW